jgi:quercetin dioxygenase-like cupin family protein
MAFPGKIIVHPFTGEKIEFLETGSSTDGKLLKMRISTPPGIGTPFSHYHLNQQEEFRIESGQLEFVVEKKKIELKEGDYLKIPVRQNHTYKNKSEQSAIKIVELKPAGNFEFFVENMVGLAEDGKTNKNGIPNPIQMMMLQYETEIYIANIPRPIQFVLWKIAELIGRWIGLKPYYDKYSK